MQSKHFISSLNGELGHEEHIISNDRPIAIKNHQQKNSLPLVFVLNSDSKEQKSKAMELSKAQRSIFDLNILLHLICVYDRSTFFNMRMLHTFDWSTFSKIEILS
jgi:hypothetical protein